VVSLLVLINEVALRWAAQLPRSWVTACGQLNHLNVLNHPSGAGKSNTSLSGWGYGRVRSRNTDPMW